MTVTSKKIVSAEKLVIGIAGKAGVGKDALAEYLVKTYAFTRMAMADSLKEAVSIIYQLPIEYFYDQKLKENTLQDFPEWTPRKLLQIIGTELLRKQVYDDIWVYSLAQKIKKHSNAAIVIPDIRFPNERYKLDEFIPGIKNVFIKVIRPGYEGNVGIIGHDSEKFDIPCEHTIINDSTLEDFYKKIDTLMNELAPGRKSLNEY